MELWKLWERFGHELSEQRDFGPPPGRTAPKQSTSTLTARCFNLMGRWRTTTRPTATSPRPDKVLSWDVHLYAKGGKAVYKYITPASLRRD